MGPLHVIAGLALFVSAFVPGAQDLLAELAGLQGNLFSPFLLAVLGPTIASWGVLFTAVVCQFVDYPTRRLWNAMLLSIAIWAPLDTALCWYFGVYGGIAINTAVMIVLVALLIKVRPPRK